MHSGHKEEVSMTWRENPTVNHCWQVVKSNSDEIFYQWDNQTLQNACNILLKNRWPPNSPALPWNSSLQIVIPLHSFLMIQLPSSSLCTENARQGSNLQLIRCSLKCGKPSPYGTIHSTCVLDFSWYQCICRKSRWWLLLCIIELCKFCNPQNSICTTSEPFSC